MANGVNWFNKENLLNMAFKFYGTVTVLSLQ